MPILGDLGVNVLASAVWLVAGLAGARLHWYVAKGSSLRSVWRIRNPRRARLHIVAAAVQPQQTSEYSRPSTGLGELYAVAYLKQSLQEAYPNNGVDARLCFSSGFSATNIRDTIVSVGGPRHNRITRLLGEKIPPRYEFIMSPTTQVRDVVDGRTFTPVIVDGTTVKDYGLITRAANPYNSDSFVFILAGAHTHGVSAAARMFTGEYAKHLAAAVRHLGDAWQVLIEVENVDNEIFPTVVESATIAPGRSRVGS